MPIPAGAGVIAAVVHFSRGEPITSWYTALTWVLLLVAVAYLMVSTWRFYSFKDIDFRSRQPFRLIVLFGALFAAIWFYSTLGPVCHCAALHVLGRVLALAVDLPAQEALRLRPPIRRLPRPHEYSFQNRATAHPDRHARGKPVSRGDRGRRHA